MQGSYEAIKWNLAAFRRAGFCPSFGERLVCLENALSEGQHPADLSGRAFVWLVGLGV